MKTLHIVRHGETDYNLANIVQGKGLNPSLNATGKQQALQLYRHYSESKFDFIFTSTLKRTHETVTHFLKDDTPWQPMHHLDEISWGELEGKQAFESRERIHALLENWRMGNLDDKIAGGESPLELAQHHKRFVAHYRALPHRNLLVCTHGRAMRILLSTMLETPLTEMDQYHHKNTSVYTLRDDGKRITLLGSNSLEHLTHAVL